MGLEKLKPFLVMDGLPASELLFKNFHRYLKQPMTS